MIFDDYIQKMVVPIGIASDKVNRELVKILCEVYIQGFRDCDYCKMSGKEYDMKEVEDFVTKKKESFR